MFTEYEEYHKVHYLNLIQINTHFIVEMEDSLQLTQTVNTSGLIEQDGSEKLTPSDASIATTKISNVDFTRQMKVIYVYV